MFFGYTKEEMKEMVKGTKMLRSTIGWGIVPTNRYYVLDYKGKFGKGFTVKYDSFIAKNGKTFCHMDYYIREE